MATRPRLGAGLLALLVGSAALAGCGGDSGPTLTVYSGRHYGIESAFADYEEQTGVKVEFLTGNDAELRERIAAEGEDTEADVYLTVDAGTLWAAGEDDLFAPLDSTVLDEAIPTELRDGDNRWFGLAVRTRTIVYNTEVMESDEVPTRYAELAEPEWKGRVCLRNANNDYQQSLVASMIAADGEEAALETLRGWSTNAEIYANDVELLEAMAVGACDVGIANHYYLARLLEEEPDTPVDLVWAEQDGRGVHVNISGGGITKYADDVDLGRAFMEWLATDGQDGLVAGNHEYPANPTVPPEPLIAEEFGTDFVRDDLRAEELGALNDDAVALMDKAGFG